MTLKNLTKEKYLWMWIVLSSICMIPLSYLFDETRGLLSAWYLDGELVLEYVNQLYSSGSDDDITIELGIILYIPLIMVYLITRKITLFSIFVHAVLVTIQSFCFLCIEVGSIFDTIFYGRNYILLLWMLNYFFLIYLLFKSFFVYERLNKDLTV